MSHNISSSDIHVRVDGHKGKGFNSVTIEKEDGLTKMSWTTKFNKANMQKLYSESEPIVFFVERNLLLGKYYSPYILHVYFSRSDTGHSQYYARVLISRPREQPLEDHNNKEQSSTMKKSEDPLCGIWISVNQTEKIPFERKVIDEREVWGPTTI